MLARAWDSDLAYQFPSFPRWRLASAVLALILLIAAFFAPLIAPHDPMDVASLFPDGTASNPHRHAGRRLV